LAGLFIPDEVLYGIVNGHDHCQHGKNQCEYGEFPWDNLIQLDPSKDPNQYDGNHLKSKAGIPAIIT
jgi:hypothetical protein